MKNDMVEYFFLLLVVVAMVPAITAIIFYTATR